MWRDNRIMNPVTQWSVQGKFMIPIPSMKSERNPSSRIISTEINVLKCLQRSVLKSPTNAICLGILELGFPHIVEGWYCQRSPVFVFVCDGRRIQKTQLLRLLISRQKYLVINVCSGTCFWCVACNSEPSLLKELESLVSERRAITQFYRC